MNQAPHMVGLKAYLRKHPEYDAINEKCLKTEPTRIDTNMGFAHMLLGENSVAQITDTKFDKSPVGSYLTYQTPFTESNFSSQPNLTNVSRNNHAVSSIAHSTISSLR